MRSVGRAGLGGVLVSVTLAAYGEAAWALDPLPVHTATTRLSATNLQPADRLALADAVAQVFVEAGFRDVISATETRNRLQDVGPVGLSCDAAECAQNVWNPLHARGLILVRQQRTRTRVTFTLQYLNLRGEVIAEEQRDEPITSWAEAIAFARAAATALALRLPAEYRGPPVLPVLPDAGAAPTVSVPDAGAPPPPETQVVVVREVPVERPVEPPTVYTRRPWEIGLGGGLVAGGLALTGVGLYNLGVHGTEVSDAGSRTIEQRCALGASVSNTAQGTQCEGIGVVTPLLLGVGIASLGAGIFLLIDGLRLRPELAPAAPSPAATPRTTWRLGASPLARGGGFFTLSGGF
jgi:hypothetical protein